MLLPARTGRLERRRVRFHRVRLGRNRADMAKNTLMYNALTDLTKKDFEGLQKVITEGGK